MSQPDMFDEVMKKASEITGVPEPDAHWSDLLAANPPDLPVIAPINLPQGWADAPPVKVLTTAELIESAEIIKRTLVEAEQSFDAEFAPMRSKLKDAEDALRGKALAQGESIKGAHIQVQIVSPSMSVKWDDKALTGAVAMLPAEWRQAILAHRKVEEKPASTRVVYK